jgi:hypothetical protein
VLKPLDARHRAVTQYRPFERLTKQILAPLRIERVLAGALLRPLGCG